MLVAMIFGLALSGTLMGADPPTSVGLEAPARWGGETITLPPGFARDMDWKGVEHIRFAPGMMQPASDTFFCYAFVFELQPESDVAAAALRSEFLKYYRGLCTAVLRDARPDVDTTTFTLELKPVVRENPDEVLEYTGVLNWVEPFATRRRQSLNLEIRVWKQDDRSYVLACVSPQDSTAVIWNQLRQIRANYVDRQAG